MNNQKPTVSFTQMKDGTKADYELLHELEKPYLALTPDRVLDELRRQGEVSIEGYQITRLDHALQSATRAEKTALILIGSWRPCFMMLAMVLPHKIMIAFQLKSSVRLCAGKYLGPLNITVFSR